MKHTREPDQPKRFRIGAYLRVSSQRQATEGDSLEAQRNEISKCIDLKKMAGWNVESVQYYVEPGRSAKDQNRPKLQQLKQDVRSGKINLVMCLKLDRITRSILDFAELWAMFKSHGVSVVSVREDFDTSSYMGEAMLKLIMVFAELERNLTAERTAVIMVDRMNRGLWNGGWQIGYKRDPNIKDRLVPDDEWAPIIRTQFFEALVKLGSAGAVQRALFESGIRTPRREARSGRVSGGQPFAKQQVIRVLRNPLYIGKLKYGGQVFQGNHDPIISEQLFSEVQRLLARTEQRRTNNVVSRGRTYLLSGIIRCNCGRIMTPKGATGRNQQSHPYYECTRQIHDGVKAECSAPRLPAQALEDVVLSRLKEISGQPAARDRIVAAAVKLVSSTSLEIEAQINSIQQLLRENESTVANLVSSLKVLGEKVPASVRDEFSRLEDQKAQLTEQLEQLRGSKADADSTTLAARQFIENWQGVGQLLEEATPEEKKTLVQHLVEVIELKLADSERKAGSYALRLRPESPYFEKCQDGKELRPAEGETTTDRPLTERPVVRVVDDKAPRPGLEPGTNRLH